MPPVDAHFDMALVKTSQAISAETVPQALFERIPQVLVDVAGANRGAVLLREADGLFVQARSAVIAVQ